MVWKQRTTNQHQDVPQIWRQDPGWFSWASHPEFVPHRTRSTSPSSGSEKPLEDRTWYTGCPWWCQLSIMFLICLIFFTIGHQIRWSPQVISSPSCPGLFCSPLVSVSSLYIWLFMLYKCSCASSIRRSQPLSNICYPNGCLQLLDAALDRLLTLLSLSPCIMNIGSKCIS